MRFALVVGSLLLGAVLFGLLFLQDSDEGAADASELGLSPVSEAAGRAEGWVSSESAPRAPGALDVAQVTTGNTREAVAELQAVHFTGRILDLEGEPRGDKPFRLFVGDQEQRIRTKRDGSFRSESLGLTTQEVRIYATWLVEHGTNAFELNVRANEPIEGEVGLGDLTPVPLYKGIAGRVVGPLGEPVANAGIAGGGGATRSDAQGQFRLVAPRDQYAVRARELNAGSSDRVFVEDGRSGIVLQLGVRANPLIRLSSSDPALLEHVALKAVELPVRKELNLVRGGAQVRGEWMLPRCREGEVELTFSHALTGTSLWSEVVAVEAAAEGEGYLCGGRTLERALEQHCSVATVQVTCASDAWSVVRVLSSSRAVHSEFESDTPFQLELQGDPWSTVVPAGASLGVAFQATAEGRAYSSWEAQDFELLPGYQTLELAGPIEIELVFRADSQTLGDLRYRLLSITESAAAGGPGDFLSSRRIFRTQIPAFDAGGNLRLGTGIRVQVPRAGTYTLELTALTGGATSWEDGVLDRSGFEAPRLPVYRASFEVFEDPSGPIEIASWQRFGP